MFIVEPVERRILLVTFIVNGTNVPDTIDLVVSGSDVIATVNGSPTSMPDETVTDIVINAFDGADTVTIRSNGDNPVSYNGGSGGGEDSVALGSSTNGLGSILADVTLTNPGDFNRITFNDTANTTGRVAEFDVLNLAGSDHGRITGLAPAALLYKLADTANPITVNGGSGADTFNFRATPGPNAPRLTVNGNDGSDTFNFGSASSLVNPIDGQVTVSGGAAVDSVVFNDQNEEEPFGFTVTATTVARFDMATITYGEIESLNINAGNTGFFGGVHTVNGTSSTTPVRLNPGPKSDILNINETHPDAPVIVGSSLGPDSLRVNEDASGSARVVLETTQRFELLLIGSGGLTTLAPGGANVLRVASLDITGTGTLDLNDGSMIIDYEGSSPIGTVQPLLASGYASGAWTGNGIRSSVAAAIFGRALGYAEATDLFSTFPATFENQSVDNTSILIKHTFYGDANLTGNVNLPDFNRLAGNFGFSPRRWSEGNFNFDSGVTLADFNLLAGNFGSARASGKEPEVGSNEEDERAGLMDQLL